MGEYVKSLKVWLLATFAAVLVLFSAAIQEAGILRQLRAAHDMQVLRLVSALALGGFDPAQVRLRRFSMSEGPTALLYMSQVDFRLPSGASDPLSPCPVYEVRAEPKQGVAPSTIMTALRARVYLALPGEDCPAFGEQLPSFAVAGEPATAIFLPADFCQASVSPAKCRQRGADRQQAVPLLVKDIFLDDKATVYEKVSKLYQMYREFLESRLQYWSIQDLRDEYAENATRFYQSRFITAPQIADIPYRIDPIGGPVAGTGPNDNDGTPRGRAVTEVPNVSFMDTLLPVRWVLPLATVFFISAQMKIFSIVRALSRRLNELAQPGEPGKPDKPSEPVKPKELHEPLPWFPRDIASGVPGKLRRRLITNPLRAIYEYNQCLIALAVAGLTFCSIWIHFEQASLTGETSARFFRWWLTEQNALDLASQVLAILSASAAIFLGLQITSYMPALRDLPSI